MFETKPGVTNGKVIQELLDICNDWFTERYNKDKICKFCKHAITGNNSVNHKDNCPIVLYAKFGKQNSKILIPMQNDEKSTKTRMNKGFTASNKNKFYMRLNYFETNKHAIEYFEKQGWNKDLVMESILRKDINIGKPEGNGIKLINGQYFQEF